MPSTWCTAAEKSTRRRCGDACTVKPLALQPVDHCVVGLQAAAQIVRRTAPARATGDTEVSPGCCCAAIKASSSSRCCSCKVNDMDKRSRLGRRRPAASPSARRGENAERISCPVIGPPHHAGDHKTSDGDRRQYKRFARYFAWPDRGYVLDLRSSAWNLAFTAVTDEPGSWLTRREEISRAAAVESLPQLGPMTNGGGSVSMRYSNCRRNSSTVMPAVAANLASSAGCSKSSRRRRIM